MNSTQASALPLRTPRWARDPYRFPGLEHVGGRNRAAAVEEADDYRLAAPAPEERLPFTLAASDRRRLDLHAALTATGIAPRPGDLEAINVLSTLDDTTIRTVLRWIASP